MEFSNYHIENIERLLKLKDSFLFIKCLMGGVFIIGLIGSLFFIKIPRQVTLEGPVECLKNECTLLVRISSSFKIPFQDIKEITFNEKEKVKKISFAEPSVVNDGLVNNLLITVSNKQLKNNQAVKGTIILANESIMGLFLQSLKGGEAFAQ